MRRNRDDDPQNAASELEAAGGANSEILDLRCVRACIVNNAACPFPYFILDTSLQIIWVNDSFSELFPEEVHARDGLLSLISLPEERNKRDIIRNLRSPDHGNAWKGHIEVRRKSLTTVLGNLLIGPLFNTETDEGDPIGFRAILDDITDSRRELVRNTFSGLLEASLLKDQDTGTHISRVNQYSRLLAESLVDRPGYEEVNREFVETIGFVAAMHDVGKIGTPDDILNKDGSLDDWEWDVMKEHTINGAYILNRYPSPMAKQIALFHHEKWDGSGYPYSISSDLIPLASRIVAMADVYDALRMERVYKPAYTHMDALEELEEGIEKHFDPGLASCFLEKRAAMKSIFEDLSDR